MLDQRYRSFLLEVETETDDCGRWDVAVDYAVKAQVAAV
jgi:hypothetical protein